MPKKGDTCMLYVEVVPWSEKDLTYLERLKVSKDPPVRHLRSRSQSVEYLMRDASGKGFGYEIWR